MTTTVDIDAITALIAPLVAAHGLALVRVAMLGGTSDPTLQVMAERPDTRQLNLDDCATLSRALSDVLDAEDPIAFAYRLEVSSPGIDRPLTRLSDYADWATHDARIRLSEALDGRKQFEGALVGVEGADVCIDVPKLGVMRLPFEKIATAKLLLTARLIKATAPLEADGADIIRTES